MCLWQGYFILVALMESCVNSGGVSSRVLVSGDSNAINHIMVFPACSYMSRMATIAFKSRTCCLSSDICLGAVHSVTHSACCRHVATGGLVEASAVKLEVGGSTWMCRVSEQCRCRPRWCGRCRARQYPWSSGAGMYYFRRHRHKDMMQ